MKKSAIIALSTLLFATTSFSTFAEGPQQDPDDQQQQVKRPPQNEQKGNQQQGHDQQQQGNRQQGHDQQQQGNRQQGHDQQQQASGHRQPQHNGQQPDFRKGRPLPKKYRGEGYQVNDWHQRGLKQPPAGHRWQNIDGNYVLIAVATGVITSVIAHQ